MQSLRDELELRRKTEVHEVEEVRLLNKYIYTVLSHNIVISAEEWPD